MTWELILVALGSGIIGLFWVLIMALWEDSQGPSRTPPR